MFRMTFTPSLFGIGSCRILSPLTRLEESGRVTLRHNGVPWLTHSTKDALQKISIMMGDIVVRDDQKDFLSPEPHKNMPERAHPTRLTQAECIIIEISSIKNLSYLGFEVQQWYWQNLVRNAGIDLKCFTNALREPPDLRCLDFLPNETPQIVRDFAHEAVYHVQNGEDLELDLHHIDQRLQKPMILVPHMDITEEDGGYYAERRLITTTLKKYCDQTGHICFDPVPFIYEYGLRKAIIDLGHYTPEFVPVLTEHLYEAMRQRLT